MILKNNVLLSFVRHRLWAQFIIPMSLLVIFASGLIIVFSISNMSDISNAQLESQNRQLAEAIQGSMFDVLSVGDNDAVKRQFAKLNQELSGLYVYVYDREGKIFFSTDIETEGKPVSSYIGKSAFLDVQSMIDTGKNSEQMFDTSFGKEEYGVVNMVVRNEQKCFHCHGSYNKVLGGISVCSTKEEVKRAITSGIQKNILVGLAGLVLLIVFTVFFFQSMVSRKVKLLLKATTKMRERDLTHVSVISGRNEIDHILARINLVNQYLRDSIKQIIDSSEHLNDSSHGLNDISRTLFKGCHETSDNASSVAAASEEMSTTLNSIASAMEQSTSNLNTITSASEEMSATVKEISKNTKLTKTTIEKVTKEFINTGLIVEELGVTAKDVDAQTDEIRTISENVSLLALNARIESARAGEAGKGFAVVAEEIAALAVSTKEFTDKIDEKLTWMQEKTDETVKSMKSLTESLKESDQAVSDISSSVEEQNITTSEVVKKLVEVSGGISEANDNVNQGASAASIVAKKISEVERASKEMEKGSRKVDKEADSLSKMAEKLKEILDTFKV